MYTKILTPLFYLIFISGSVAQINCPNGQSGYPIVQGFDYAPSKDNTWSPLIVGDIGHNNSGQISAGKWGFKNTSGKNKTGPNTPYNGSYYLTYRSNNPAPDGLSAKANVDLDLTSFTDDAELSFYLYAYGTGIGDLKVNIDNDATDNFESFVTLQVYSGQIQDSKTEPWELKQISLQNYLGNKVTIQFEYKDLDIDNNGDISLDFLRVETCGDVCVPGQIVFSNEQYNTVDFDWSPSGNQTNIQYSVSDADATSQEGTIVDLANAANQTVSLSNLEKLTTYALWVRSECTSGYSGWSKTTFKTLQKFDYEIPSLGSVNGKYIYDHNNSGTPKEFTFQSTDGSPLLIRFNKGELHTSNSPYKFQDESDYLVVKKGLNNPNGVVLYRGYGWGDNENGHADIEGVSVFSNSGELTFYVESNTSSSAKDENLEAIDFTVNSLDQNCQSFDVNFEKVFDSIDCENSNSLFYIDVQPNASGTYEVTNNITSDSVQINGDQVTKIGPFNFNEEVVLTVTKSNNCYVLSETFVTETCPPVNDFCSSAVDLISDTPAVFDFLEATPSELSIPKVSTGNKNGPNNDVWFKFNATNSVHQIDFITEGELRGKGGKDGQAIAYALYKGDCSGLEEMTIYSGSYPYGPFPDRRLITPFLEIGETYYLRVYSAYGHKETLENLWLKLSSNNAPLANAIPLSSNTLCANQSADPNSFYSETNTSGGISSNPKLASCFRSGLKNPSWHVFEVGNNTSPGSTIEFEVKGYSNNDITNTVTVNTAIWKLEDGDKVGEFNFYKAPTVDCSYSNSGQQKVKSLTIPSANPGDRYLILAQTDYDTGATVRITQTNYVATEEIITTTPSVSFNESELTSCDSNSVVLRPEYELAETFKWYDISGNLIEDTNEPSLEVTVSGKYIVEVVSPCNESKTAEITVFLPPNANENVSDLVGSCNQTEFDLKEKDAEIRNGENPRIFSIYYYMNEQDAINNSNAVQEVDNKILVTLDASSTIYARLFNSNNPDCYDITSFKINLNTSSETIINQDALILCEDSNTDESVKAVVDLNALVSSVDSNFKFYDNNGVEIDSPSNYLASDQDLIKVVATSNTNGCESDESFTLTVNPKLVPEFDSIPATCETETIELPTKSINDIEGEWALVNSTNNLQTYVFTPDSSFCASVVTIEIEITSLEIPDFNQVDPICETQSVNLPSTSINGITGTWALISEDASSASYEFSPDANQCADITTMVVQINELIIPYFEQIEPICSGSEVQLPNVSEGGANISGEWSLIDESVNYAIYEFTPNSNQCASEVEMTIEIIGCEVPEGFSPNGDAYNQYFDLSSFGVKRLEVYNRYGKLVYSRNNYKKEWFGQDSGNGALPTGTYFYIITFNDNSKPKSGSVYINR